MCLIEFVPLFSTVSNSEFKHDRKNIVDDSQSGRSVSVTEMV